MHNTRVKLYRFCHKTNHIISETTIPVIRSTDNAIFISNSDFIEARLFLDIPENSFDSLTNYDFMWYPTEDGWELVRK